MRLVILKKNVFASKRDGKEYVKLSTLAQDGSTPEIFVSKEKFDSLKVDDQVVCTPDDLKEVFASYKSVDVVFNNRGQVDSVQS